MTTSIDKANVQTKKVGLDWWGHQMDAKDVPTLDDDGEYSSYAKCSKCGAIENTDESVKVCSKAEYVHISVLSHLKSDLLAQIEREVIGEDDDIDKTMHHDSQVHYLAINFFRKQQRQALKHLKEKV